MVFECSGNPAIVGELYKFLRDGGWGKSDEGGRIHLQGDYPAPTIIYPYFRWFVKNLTLSMTCAVKPE